MLCPICKTELVITERQGIEVDYCPKCRGVWLDRGELDKLIERAGMGSGPFANPNTLAFNSPGQNFEYPVAQTRPGYGYDDDDDDRYRYPNRLYDQPPGPYRKRRKGFLADLFDFD